MSWRGVGKTSIYITLSTVSTQMLQWIIMSSLAHREGPKILGIYALGQAFVLPLQFLAFLAIRQRYLTLNGDVRDNFLAMRIVVPALTFLLALGCIFLIYGFETIFKMTACICLLKYAEGFFDLAYSKMQKDNRAKLLAKVSISRSIIAAIIFLSVYKLSGNLYLSLLAVAFQQFVLMPWICRDLISFLPQDRFTLKFSAASAGALIPFAFSSVLSSLTSSLPRLMLDGLVGSKELGYYTAVITIVSLGQIVVGSVGQSLLEPLARALHHRDARLFWSSILFPAFGTQLGCYLAASASLFLGADVMALVYGPAFNPAVPLLTVASITSGPLFAASFFTAALFASGRKYALLANQSATLGITLILTFFLVPVFQAKGAFLSMGISGIFQMVLCSLMLRSHLRSASSTQVVA